MFGNLNHNEIEEILKQQIVGHLGCHADDITYVVPISYVYDGTYIYGYTFEGMKLNMMRANSKVCFQVDNLSSLANWQSVVTWGKFEELADEEQRYQAIQQLMSRHLPMTHSETMHIVPQWPFPATDTKTLKGITFRILLEKKTGRYERSTDQQYFAT